MKDTKLDGVSFTTENILKFKSEAEWLVYCEDNLHWYQDQPGRIDKLKAVYEMAKEQLTYGDVIKIKLSDIITEADYEKTKPDKKKESDKSLETGTQDSTEEIE